MFGELTINYFRLNQLFQFVFKKSFSCPTNVIPFKGTGALQEHPCPSYEQVERDCLLEKYIGTTECVRGVDTMAAIVLGIAIFDVQQVFINREKTL